MASLPDSMTVGDVLHEAAVRLGVPKDRLTATVRAAQVLSKADFEVVTSLTEFARAGTSMKKRKALSRGILNVLRKIQDSGDPLTEGAVSALVLAEMEVQTGT